jgi:hypothetical protein
MRVLFLFIGEPHHVFHALPIAAELKAVRPDFAIEVAVSSDKHVPLVSQVLAAYPGVKLALRILKPPRVALHLRKMGLARGVRRLTLMAALPYLRTFDAIVVPSARQHACGTSWDGRRG